MAITNDKEIVPIKEVKSNDFNDNKTKGRNVYGNSSLLERGSRENKSKNGKYKTNKAGIRGLQKIVERGMVEKVSTTTYDTEAVLRTGQKIPVKEISPSVYKKRVKVMVSNSQKKETNVVYVQVVLPNGMLMNVPYERHKSM